MLNTNPTRGILPRFKRSPLAFLTMVICATFAGCATAPPPSAPAPVARDLPPVPDRLMQPVPLPALQKGQDARAALRLTQTALIEANARLVASAGWYESVRKSYAILKPK